MGRSGKRLVLLVAAIAAAACRERPAAMRADAALPAPASSSAKIQSSAPPIAVLALPLGYDSPTFPKRVTTTPDPRFGPDDHVVLDDDFVFELGTGSGLDGLDVTTLAAGGRARHTWRTVVDGGARWNTGDFRIEDDELSKLAALLEEIRFLSQPRGITGDVHDGASWIVFVRTKGRVKYVSLSNAFPEPFMRLGRFVVELVNRHPDLRARHLEFAESGLHDRHLWRGMDAYAGSSEPYYIWLCVLPELSRPFAHGTSVRGRLVDRTRPRTVGSMETRISAKNSSACLTLRPRDIDARHEYELELELANPTERTKLAPTAVLTRGAPQLVVIPSSAGDR